MSDLVSAPQAQHVFVTCPSNRAILIALVEAAQEQLAKEHCPASVVQYGISAKQRDGFVVIEVAQGFSSTFLSWLSVQSRVLDYVVYDVPYDLVEEAASENA